jgi:simple sugar transport system ATP-binding protein
MDGEALPFLVTRGLSKSYGSIRAVADVDFTIGPGEIVALVGDNGAGKSTLVKMICGAMAPDAGRIEIDGEVVRFTSPSHARHLGIEALHQDLALLPNLDVTTNLYLGREMRARGWLGRLGFVSRAHMRDDVRQHLDSLRITIPKIAGTPVELMSGGQRQSVAVARAIVWAKRLVIMDEPTAALGVQQARAVLELAKRVCEHGTSVMIISHILPHVLEIADRVVVLRHGRKVADVPAVEVDEHRLIQLIVGLEDGKWRPRPTRG